MISPVPLLYRISKTQSRRNLYEWLRSAIAEAQLASDARILSIGAGGDVEAELRRAGLSFTSVDIDPSRHPDVIADLEKLTPFANESIDAVFVLEVLEHLKNPMQGVAELERVLRPGAVVIGSTPFLLAIHDEPHDYYRFTYHGLQHLFRDFEHVLLRERNGELRAAGVLFTRRLIHVPHGQALRTLLLSPLLILLSSIAAALDRLLPSRNGTTGYFFVFRKPL
ncbi:MAG TPA: class I SAM-dependent methyltransferase [Thermoanaerobaculia bacterium]